MTQVAAVKRAFIFKGITLPDPGFQSSPEAVKNHYLGVYPDLLNTQIVQTTKDNVTTYEFKPKTGHHG